MPVHNNDIAAVFEEIADLLEIEQANPFRIRAYRNAARTVQGLGEEVRDLIQEGFDLDQLPGIGEALAEKIAEIVRTGKCQALEKLRQEGGKGLVELLHIPGLGPKRVAILYHELDVQTPQQLLRAIKDGRLRQLRGFGEKTEQNILDMLQVHAQQERRFKLAVAAQYAQSLVDYLREANEIEEIVIAGSYRRCKETVGDLDILVTTTQPKPVVEHFTRYDEVKEVLSQGDHPFLHHPAQWPAGGPARGQTGEFRRRLALLHRLQATQHRDPPPGPTTRPQDKRIWRV